MQTNRLFEIIYILLNKQSVTAKELAERFNVSSRTIYRDVDMLSLAGIPVYTEISTIFNKSAVNWLEVDFSDWSFANGSAFNDFKSAILEHRIAEFDYYSTYGEKTHRCIEPIQLWFKSKSWYIKGFCLTRQDIRLFKLTRVKNLTVTDEHFPERDLLATPSNPDPDTNQKRDETLKLKISPKMTYRVYDEFDEDSVEKQLDGSFIVSVAWPEDEWVYGTILSYGEYIKVLEPEHIREIIKEKAQKISKKYL